MKKIISMLAIATLVGAFWSCSEDNPAVDNGVTISGVPATAEIENLGTVGPVTATIEAADGLASLVVTKGTASFASETYAGETSATYEFSYTATAEDEDKLVTFTFTATDKDGDVETVTHVLSVGAAPEVPTTIIVDANITENTTWETGKTYVLAGRVTVLDGKTLTIQPGVVVKGQAGTGANATALLVARGAKLMAEGTAALPIIFTSVADEITPADIAAGNFESPNLDPDVNGLWGGVIVLGKAKISTQTKDIDGNFTGVDIEEVQIEGIPTSDANGLYGGSDDADNSGVIKYISIRHGGTNIGAGNEINGLTLGGVGSGTVIENVEVVANQDDGIEWFGGTVNVKNIVVWNVGDDGLDTDQAWSGTAENFVIVTVSGHSFELDGPEGTYGTTAGSTTTFHTFKNGTVVASNADIASENLINTDNNSGVKFDGLFITGLENATGNNIINRISASSGILEFLDVIINVPAGDAIGDFISGGVAPTGVSAAATATKKADVSVLGWTWASKAGELTGL